MNLANSHNVYVCFSYYKHNCELEQCSRSMVGYFKRLKTSRSVSLEAVLRDAGVRAIRVHSDREPCSHARGN